MFGERYARAGALLAAARARLDEELRVIGHLGLAGLRDRAAGAGGRLEVEPAPERGTRLRLWLPVAATRDDSSPEAPPA